MPHLWPIIHAGDGHETVRLCVVAIDELLTELDAMETVAAAWQARPEGADPAQMQELRDQYLRWYARALQSVPADKADSFRDAYEGGAFTNRIKAFLLDPMAISPFYDPNNSTPFLGKWQHPFTQTFADSAAIQRALLHEIKASTAPVEDVLESLAIHLARLPRFLHDLHALGVPPIEDENDLQKALLPLLRVLYADVRREDPVSQFAGASSRVDFMLRDEGVLIETKMTRAHLSDRRLGEELLVDWGRYPHHPDCRAIFALIFDPGRYVDNASALSHDLATAGLRVPVRVLVVN